MLTHRDALRMWSFCFGDWALERRKFLDFEAKYLSTRKAKFCKRAKE